MLILHINVFKFVFIKIIKNTSHRYLEIILTILGDNSILKMQNN